MNLQQGVRQHARADLHLAPWSDGPEEEHRLTSPMHGGAPVGPTNGLAVSDCLKQFEGLPLSDQFVINALGGGERNKLF